MHRNVMHGIHRLEDQETLLIRLKIKHLQEPDVWIVMEWTNVIFVQELTSVIIIHGQSSGKE